MSTSQRHIAVLTGKRGGYGAMKPMLRAMNNDPDIRLSLLVTDQHVNKKFGATIKEIQTEFDVTAAVDMEQSDGSPCSRAYALGVCLSKMTEVLDDLVPDILVLYGDRGEVLATATSAITLRIPIAHLQGGDISGNVDEVMRHAVTKLSHLHFPSTEASARRIIAMGEEEWRVSVVGDNHIDLIVAREYTAPESLREKYGINENEAPLIVLYHPETTYIRDGYTDMCNILDAVLAENRRTFIIFPCSDHGYEEIVRAIKLYEDKPNVSIHQNIEAHDFWGLLAIAGAFIGNSSAGLIETPYFPIPSINIGDRQKGREHSNNLIHCNYEYNEMQTALKKALFDESFINTVRKCNKPFGDGYAWKRIVESLKNVELGDNLLDKRFSK